MANLGRAGHRGSPANASGARRRLWVVWLLVGCVVLSGGSSVPILEAAPPRDLPPLTDDPCTNANVLGTRMIDLAAEIDRLQDARDLALADADAMWGDPQPVEPRTSVDTLDLVSLDPDAEKERVRYLSSVWMDELRQRVRDLNRAGLPMPRGYQDGEEDFWSDFSEATLQEADRRLAKISDPCQAAIDLKLYLESQQSGWTWSEIAERAVTVPYNVVFVWALPNKWDVLDVTLKLALKPVPVLGWISTASNVYNSYETIVKTIGISAAARRAGWALETYESTHGWTVEWVDRRGREILREIKKTEEDIGDARTRLEREIAALDVEMREIGCWGIEAEAQRCVGALMNYEYRHEEAQRRYRSELQELMSRLVRKHAEASDLLTYRAPLARGACPESAVGEGADAVSGDVVGGPLDGDAGGTESAETFPDAQSERERLSDLQGEYIAAGRTTVFHDWIQEKIDTLEAQYREIGQQYLNWTTACSNRALDLPIGYILEPGGAVIALEYPARSGGGLAAGTAIASSSGAWKEGDLNHPCPENEEVTLGPFTIPAPCTLRAYISGSPPIEATMTASNSGSQMMGRLEPLLAREMGIGVDSFHMALGVGQTEAAREIVVKYPSLLWLTFAKALHMGQAGGYQCAGQSYTAGIEVVELAKEGMAMSAAAVSNGDQVRVERSWAPAAMELRDGTKMVIFYGSQVAFSNTASGGIRAALERGGNGGMRVTSPGPNFEAAHEGKTIKPNGTDFFVDTSGLKVVDGEVEVIDDASGELVVVSAGQQMNLKNGQVSDFDAALVPPFTTGSGLPVSADFFDPREEPYGAKPLIVENGSVAGGWLLVDPPARHSPKGVTWEKTPRVEMAIAEEGALRLTVPVGSAISPNDTAPRLLHKVTGDFDLEADVRIEEASGNPVSASFVVLAPGTGIGVQKKQIEWGKPAGDVWRLPPCVTRLSAGGPFQLPVFNDSGLLSRYDWPEVAEGSARVRLSRRGDTWSAAWSLDGVTWNTHTLDWLDLPATLYAGWAFEHTQGASAEPAIFTVTDIRLETASARSMDIPAWRTFAVNGSVQTQDTSVRLSLDGQSPGTARALSGEMLAGDFDTIVRFDATPWQHQPGELRRWAISAMTPDQQEAITIGCVVRDDGQRYWAHRPKGFEGVVYLLQSSPLEQPQGRLRLVRENGVVSAYYWDGEGWHQTSYGEQTQFEGPLFLRLEAFNGRANATHPWAPLSVDFTVEQIVSPVAAASLLSVAEPQAVSTGDEGGEVIVSEAQVGGRLSPVEDVVTSEPTAERWVKPTPEPLVSLAEEPGILEFTASPAEAEVGQIVTLSWQTRGGQPYLYRVDGGTQVQLGGSGLLPPAGSLVTAVVGPAGGAATYALGVLDVQSNQWLATAICEVKVVLPPPPPPLPIVPAQPVDPYQPPAIETQPQPALQPVPGAYTVIFTIGADGRPAGYVVDKAGRRFDTRRNVLTIGGPELKPDAGDRIVLKTDAPRFSLLFDCGSSPDGYSPCDFMADSPAGLPTEVVCQARDRAGYFNISGPDNWAGERHDFPGQRYPADPVLRIVFGSNW